MIKDSGKILIIGFSIAAIIVTGLLTIEVKRIKEELLVIKCIVAKEIVDKN